MKLGNTQRLIFAGIAAVLFVVSAYAQTATPVATPFGLKMADGKTVDDMIEPSGVAAIGDSGYLLIASDKEKTDKTGLSLYVVEAKTGKFIKLLENIQGNTKNPKWEALTKDADCYYYAIGSHAIDPGDSAEKLANRSRLFRFRLKGEAAGDPQAISMDLGVKEFDIKTSLTKFGIYDVIPNTDPKKIMTKIEGMTIRTLSGQKQLVIGLREPFDKAGRVQIYSAEFPADSQAATPTLLTLKSFFQFAADRPKDSPEPYKLSSIEYLAELKGFLILTSTESLANDFYGNAMWFVSDTDIETARITSKTDGDYPVTAKPIWDFPHDPADKNYVAMKAEGISLLRATTVGKTRLVIVYDNDPQSTHTDGKPHPSMMECLEMTTDFKISRVGC